MMNNFLIFWLFQGILSDEQLSHCPVLLLGNKIDIPGAAGEEYIRQYFGLYGLTTGRAAVRIKCFYHLSLSCLCDPNS